MANTILTIRGAIYFSPDYNAIIKPLMTGEFWIVESSEYLTKKDYLDRYSKDHFNENKNDFFMYKSEKYYYSGYRPIYTEDLILLSDLSELTYQEETTIF